MMIRSSLFKSGITITLTLLLILSIINLPEHDTPLSESTEYKYRVENIYQNTRSVESINTHEGENNYIDSLDPILFVQSGTEVKKNAYTIFFDDREGYNKNVALADVAYPNLNAIEIHGEKLDVLQIDHEVDKIYLSGLFDRSTDNGFELTGKLNSEVVDIKLQAVENQVEMFQPFLLENSNSTGAGIRVGIIDSGIDFTHDALTHVTYIQKDFNEDSPRGNRIHGTAVASVIAGISNGNQLGLAPNSIIISAAMGSPTSGTLGGNFLAAFDFLIANNVTVINTSWSSPTDIWNPVIDILVQENITLVGSVGNLGSSSGDNSFSVEGIGAHPKAIGVGGMTEGGNLWSYSKLGPTMDRKLKPDVIAQASSVVAASKSTGSYGLWDGTSFSSPLVAGAIAAVLSNPSNTVFDSASIKAHLLLSSYLTPGIISDDQFSIGFGHPNISRFFEKLINNTSESIILTPQNIPIGYHANLIPDSIQFLESDLITSIPHNNIDFTVNGNITDIIFKYTNLTSSQEVMPFLFNTSGISDSSYSGTITAYDTKDISNFFTLNLSVTVQVEKTAEILYDRYYTDFDLSNADRLYGTNMRYAAQILWNSGYHIMENNEQLTSVSLSGVDILWMPDLLPISIYVDTFGNTIVGPYNADTRLLIEEFVNSGGNLFINFLGLFETSNGYYSSFSTDIYSLQYLLSVYNIKASETALLEHEISSQDVWSMQMTNVTQIGNNISYADYWGNYLELVDNSNLFSRIIMEDDNGYGLIVYDDPMKGRVGVSSSNYWLDNCAIGPSSCFSYNHRDDNEILLLDLFSWFVDEERLLFTKLHTSNSSLYGEVYTTDSLKPNLNLLDFTSSIPIMSQLELTIISNDTYSFQYPISNDSIYEFELYLNDDFVKYSVVIDVQPPVINIDSITDKLINVSLPYSIDLSITDRFLSSIEINLDSIPYVSINEYLENSYTIPIELIDLSIGTHTIVVSASDTEQTSFLSFNLFVNAVNSQDTFSSEDTTSTSSDISNHNHDFTSLDTISVMRVQTIDVMRLVLIILPIILISIIKINWTQFKLK